MGTTTTTRTLRALALSLALALLISCSDFGSGAATIEEENVVAETVPRQPGTTGRSPGPAPVRTEREGTGVSESGKNVLVALTDANYAPFEFTDDKGGIIGFDVDLIREIAEDGGMRLHLINHPFPELFPLLESSKRVDLVIACLSKSPERAEIALLSDNYLTLPSAVAVRKDNLMIRNLDDLKGKRIAFIEDSIFQSTLDEVLQGDYVPVPAPSHYLSLREVILRNADAAIMDMGVLNYNIDSFAMKDLRLIKSDPRLPSHETVMAIRKDKPQILELVNQGLRNVKESGRYAAIKEKWLSHID